MGRTSSAFRSAFRVMLYGVALSAAAIAVLPWGLSRAPQTTASLPVDEPALPATDRPAEDLRRVAAAEPLPGLYSSEGSSPTPSAPFPRGSRTNSPLPDEAAHESRPVPFPRMAEADEPRSSSVPGSDSPRSEVGAPRAFPHGAAESPKTGESVPFPPPGDDSESEPARAAAPSGPPAPRPASEIVELRREVDRLSESHLQDQKVEIQKAQQILVEMQTARQIDLLRDQIGLLRDQQAETHRVAVEAASKPAAPVAPPPLPPAPLSIPAKEEVGPALPKPIEIEPAGETGRYTIRLRQAPLNVALNEVAVLAGWNVVTGPEFSGNVTATLSDVTPEEAIDAILRVHGWRVRRDGKFLLIERTSETSTRSSGSDGKAAEGELQTQVFQLQHVPAPAVLPHLQPLLTPQVGQASSGVVDRDGSAPADQIGQDRLVVRDNPAALEKISGLVAQLDLPPRQVELETVILQIERTGLVEHGLRGGLAAYLDSQTKGDIPCPRCGRRHRVAAPIDPACILPQPEWTTAGGAGWEFTQLRGTEDEFIATVKKFAQVEVVARPRLRIAHQQLAEIGMAGLVGQRSDAEIQTVGVRLVNAGSLLTVRPFVLETGEVRLHVESQQESGAVQPLSAPASGTDIVIQKECSLVIAGLHAEQTLRSGPGGRPQQARYEIVVLVTPRLVP